MTKPEQLRTITLSVSDYNELLRLIHAAARVDAAVTPLYSRLVRAISEGS